LPEGWNQNALHWSTLLQTLITGKDMPKSKEEFLPVPIKGIKQPLISIVMGSESDYETMHHTEKVFVEFNVPYEVAVVSAHRTPKVMFEYAGQAQKRGIQIIIAGAGGAAHLPGMISALTTLPVLGVPVETKSLKGMDSLLSIVQMPGGIPTATFAIGAAGATNAALFALQILALNNPVLNKKLITFREDRASSALAGNKSVQKRIKEKHSLK
jgi:5-(carboxyamino)imidazole ribonucleotide mutase